MFIERGFVHCKRHFGTSQASLYRWLKECGAERVQDLRRQFLRDRGAPVALDRRIHRRPCPADFDKVFVEQGWSRLEQHYRAHRHTIARWIEERGGDRLKAERDAFLKVDTRFVVPKALRAASLIRTSRLRHRVEALALFGKSDQAIADRLGVSLQLVAWAVGTLGRDVQAASCFCKLPRNHPQPCRALQKGQLTEQQVEELHRRAARGESGRAIAAAMQVSSPLAYRYIAAWKDKQNSLRPCWCGRPARHAGGCAANTPGTIDFKKVRRLDRLIREGVPTLVAARHLRISPNAAQRYAAPVRTSLAAQGVRCLCGRPTGHPGACSENYEGLGRKRGPKPISPRLRRRIELRLLNGGSWRAIRAVTGASPSVTYRVLREMDDEARRQRRQAVQERIRSTSGGKRSEDLLERIQRAVRRGIPSHLRDDAISEMWLAISLGEMKIEDVEARAKKFENASEAQWANKYGPLSLDEALGADGSFTRADYLQDEVALDQFEDIAIGAW